MEKEQAEEYVKCRKDPVYFIKKYGKIRHPTKGLLPFELWDFQEDTVQNFLDKSYNIILKARQLGISSLCAAYAGWMANFFKNKEIYILATKRDTATNLVDKVRVFLDEVPPWLKSEITIDNFPGLNTFIEAFETRELGDKDEHFTRPAKWRIDGGWAWSNAQLIIPRALRKDLWVGYNQFWNSRPVYFSTNCIMLRKCTLTVNKLDQEKVLKFIAGYLNSSFVQIILELESKNHEGTRKHEAKEVEETIYIPTKSALDSNSNLVAEIAQQFESLKFGLTGEEETPTPRFDLDVAVAELLLQVLCAEIARIGVDSGLYPALSASRVETIRQKIGHLEDVYSARMHRSVVDGVYITSNTPIPYA